MSCAIPRLRRKKKNKRNPSRASSQQVLRIGGSPGAEPGGPREYGSVGRGLPDERFDFENYPLSWGSFDKYEAVFNEENSIGKGGFGEVFLAREKSRKHTKEFVVKAYRTDKDEKLVRIQREVKMLEMVKHGPNTLRLYDMVIDTDTGLRMLVFEFKGHPPFKNHFKDFDAKEGAYYFYALLRALKYAHERGIIHRDIKGGNVLYNAATREVTLIDWGLADFHRPDRDTLSWPGTRGYKAPELLLKYPRIDFAVDIWAVGVLMATMMFGRPYFAMSRDSKDPAEELNAVVARLGSRDYYAYVNKYRKPPWVIPERIVKRYDSVPQGPRVDIRAYGAKRGTRLATPEGIELLDCILVYDHEARPNVNEVLSHSYFDCVREQFCPTVPAPADVERSGGVSLSSDWSDIIY